MGVSATFQLLAELPREQRIPLVEAALREPYPDLQSAAFDALVDPAGLHRPDIVIQHYVELLPGTRERLSRHPKVFSDAAREEMVSASETSRRAGYEVLAALDGFSAMSLVARGLTDLSALVRNCCADLLEKLVQEYYYHQVSFRMHGDRSSRDFIESHRGDVLRALGDLLRAFPVDGKRIFLDAAIELGPDAYPLITDVVLARRDVPTFGAFVNALSSSSTLSAVELLLRLYLEPRTRLREVAVDVMRQRRDGAFAALVAATLARMPQDEFETLAGRVRDIPWWGAVEAAVDLDSASALKLIEFVAASGLDRAAREARILAFQGSPHAVVRERVLSTLRSLDYAGTAELAAGFLRDPSDEVRVAAARAIAAHGGPEKVRLLLPFLNSPHAELREIAAREVSAASLERFFRCFDRLDPRTRKSAARALAKIDGRITDRLAEEITSLDGNRRLKALQVIGYVEAEGDLREPLVELLTDPNRWVRATALRIVRLSGSVEGLKRLVGALHDPDARVRANAIEAFEDGGDPRMGPLLEPFLADPDPRARANAAKALGAFGRSEGWRTLQQMLEDPEERTRISAAWALGEGGFPGAADLLRARVTRESSSAVGQRISEALQKLAQRTEGAAGPAGR